jgi:hypothetical protein
VQTQYSLSTGPVQTQFQRYFSFFNSFNEIIERYFEIIFRQYRLSTDSVQTQYRLNTDSVQTQQKDDIHVFFGKLKKYLSLHTPYRLFSECCLKITKRILCKYYIIFFMLFCEKIGKFQVWPHLQWIEMYWLISGTTDFR